VILYIIRGVLSEGVVCFFVESLFIMILCVYVKKKKWFCNLKTVSRSIYVCFFGWIPILAFVPNVYIKFDVCGLDAGRTILVTTRKQDVWDCSFNLNILCNF